jgi:glyoxylase-like metal-dependent hydrolase (beta-lactamase superfamily II)
MGDIFFNGRYPYIDLDGGGTIQGMISAVEKGLVLSNDETRVIAGHGPMSDRAGLQEYHDFLVTVRDRVQALIDQGMSLEQAIAAKPTAEWDDILGEVWITGDQLVTFVYNSLTGVDHFTRPESAETTTE